MSEAGNGWVKAADVAQVPVGSLLGVKVGDEQIVLANAEGTVYALEDQCSHEEFPLSDGELEGETLECIFHGATFDVCSGKATRLPAIRPVKTYEVEVRGDGIFVRLN